MTQFSPSGGPLSIGVHGYVGKKTVDPKALKLLVAASEYAAAAASRLGEEGTSALPQLIDHYVDIVFGLEVHFVFPNLSAEKRDLLVAIMKVRNSISAVLSGASRVASAKEKTAQEKLKTDLERSFLELRCRIVESGIETELDPVQQKIFQDEFFSITLDKACSTTLFFRTEAAGRPKSRRIRVQAPDAVAKTEPSLLSVREGIPLVEPPAQRQGPALQMAREAISAKPPVESNFAGHQSNMANRKPDLVRQLPEVSLVLSDVVPKLANAAPKPTDVPLKLADVTPHPREQQASRGKTILLISADSGAQDLIGRALQQAGHSLLLATAAFTGYAIAMRERPDLVLVDLSLSSEVSGPDACLDGRGVLKMLSKLPSGRALPFLGLVSNGASETEAQVLASGARACLRKPLDPRVVLDAVQNACAGTEANEVTPSSWTVSASI